MKKILAGFVVALLPVFSHAINYQSVRASTSNIDTPSLQTGTMNLSSGTITNLNVGTIKITNTIASLTVSTLTAANVTVSSNTVLPGATFYSSGPINMSNTENHSGTVNMTGAVNLGGAGNAVRVSSNTVLPGATFYASGIDVRLSTPTISGPMSMSNNYITNISSGVNVQDAAAYSQVPTITAWTSWTPTFTSFGTVGTINFFWRRVGDTIEVRGTAVAGTTAGATAKVSLPNGYTIDTTKVGSQTSFGGYFLGGSTSTPFWSANWAAVAFYDGSDATAVFFAKTNSGASLTKENATNICQANEIFQLTFSFPATGLGVH